MKTNVHTVPLVFIPLLVATFAVTEVFSQQITYIPQEESRLWVEGRSNINEFECEANRYSGEALLYDEEQETDFVQDVHERLSISVEIRVDGFECGKNRMNRDLQNALKSDEYPEITFLFDSAELLQMPKHPNDPFEVEVKGTLTIAGETRDIHFITYANYLEADLVRAVGNTTIKMSDFNIDPPTAFMGLIKADDELTVKFNLIAKERNTI